MTRASFFQRSLALVLAAGSAGGCSAGSNGPEYAGIDIAVAANGISIEDQCISLPLLPGGTIDEDIDLAPPLTAHVFAVRDFAEVTLRGTNDPQSPDVTVSFEALRDGYTRELDVTTTDGKSYAVTLSGPCPGDLPPEPAL